MPILFFGNALIVLILPWLPAFQYGLPGFPDDPLGLSTAERIELANTGVRSIWPVGPGPELLEAARLPDDQLAFTAAEVTHMEDVRTVVRGTLIAWLLALGAIATGVAMLRPGERRERLRRALFAGGLLTGSLVGVVALVGLVSFDFFFEAFHSVLFERGTWQFPNDSTLISLYPERFWMTAALIGGLLVLIQTVIAIAIGRADPSGGGASR